MVLKSLQQAFNALFSFRTWVVVLWPPLIAGLLLLLGFFIFWTPLAQSFEALLGFAFQWEYNPVLARVLMVLSFLPILLALLLLVTSIFVTPLVLREVSARDFEFLEKKFGGSNMGSLWNSLRSILSFSGLFILTLPFWLIPGMQMVIPAILIIWLNQRVFMYDVLQDFASKDERQEIGRRYRGAVWGLGALLVVFSYIPFAFLVLPVFSAFAYSYFGLNCLVALRNRPGAGGFSG